MSRASLDDQIEEFLDINKKIILSWLERKTNIRETYETIRHLFSTDQICFIK